MEEAATELAEEAAGEPVKAAEAPAGGLLDEAASEPAEVAVGEPVLSELLNEPVEEAAEALEDLASDHQVSALDAPAASLAGLRDNPAQRCTRTAPDSFF